MPRGTKSATGEKLDDRIVVQTYKPFKKRYVAMCEAVKENPSERIRRMLEADLELYDITK
jgi:hypothetical protein